MPIGDRVSVSMARSSNFDDDTGLRETALVTARGRSIHILHVQKNASLQANCAGRWRRRQTAHASCMRADEYEVFSVRSATTTYFFLFIHNLFIERYKNSWPEQSEVSRCPRLTGKTLSTASLSWTIDEQTDRAGVSSERRILSAPGV